MPILLLTEQEVQQLLTMEMALEAVETAFRKLGIDEAHNIPRSRCQTDHVVLHVMSAAAKTLGIAGYKAYATSRKGEPTIMPSNTGGEQAGTGSCSGCSFPCRTGKLREKSYSVRRKEPITLYIPVT